jgi:Cu+-exporting ATPase
MPRRVDDSRVVLGYAAQFEDLGLSLTDYRDQTEVLGKEGQTVMFVALDDAPAGFVAVADQIKKILKIRSANYAKRDCESSW